MALEFHLGDNVLLIKGYKSKSKSKWIFKYPG